MSIKYLIKHSEEIGGVVFGIVHELFGLNIHFGQIDLVAIAWKVMGDVPGFFAAGFFGGLGGYAIRMSVKVVSILILKAKTKKNEPNS